jgi:hypothetical protein
MLEQRGRPGEAPRPLQSGLRPLDGSYRQENVFRYMIARKPG